VSANSDVLRRSLRLLARFEDGLLVILLALMIASSSGQILLRNVFSSGMSDADPFARIMVLWVAMIGAVVAARNDKHINVDVLSRLLSSSNQRRVQTAIHVLSAAVCLLITYTSLQFVIAEFDAGSRAFASVPAWLAQSVIPLGFGLISLHYLVLAVINWRSPS